MNPSVFVTVHVNVPQVARFWTLDAAKSVQLKIAVAVLTLYVMAGEENVFKSRVKVSVRQGLVTKMLKS